MTKFICLASIILLLHNLPKSGNSQDIYSKFDRAYNLDPELYNGALFKGIYPGNIKGNQFFSSQEFSKGDLQLHSGLYKDQLLNYDVYNQKLLLSFKDKNKAEKIIEVPLENVRAFTLYSKNFEILQWNSNTLRLFQSFHFKKSKLLIYYSKSLKSSSGEGNAGRQFNSIKKQVFLYTNEEYCRIRKSKDLIDLYEKSKQEQLKKWLKEAKIKIKKASDSQLESLCTFLDEN